jgi:hypothetical protein
VKVLGLLNIWELGRMEETLTMPDSMRSLCRLDWKNFTAKNTSVAYTVNIIQSQMIVGDVCNINIINDASGIVKKTSRKVNDNSRMTLLIVASLLWSSWQL